MAEDWIEVNDETLARVAQMYDLPLPRARDTIDLRRLLGQMDHDRFRKIVRSYYKHGTRLRSAAVMLAPHHLEALKQEAVKKYGMDPEASIVGAHLFGHELTQPPDQQGGKG